MEFWNVPDQAGLPTVGAAAIVGDAGVNPNVGKSALAQNIPPPFLTIPSGTFEEVLFDDVIDDPLGMLDLVNFPTRITIPDVNPPIKTVQIMGAISWGVFTLATFTSYQCTLNSLNCAGQFLWDAAPVPSWTGVSGPISRIAQGSPDLQPGDFFEFTVRHDEGSPVAVARSTFALTVLG